MSEPPNKKRCNRKQREKLVAFMADNKDVALSTFTSPMGSQKNKLKWEKLAAALAEIGPSRTIEQWKTTWRDLRSRAKANNAAANRAFNRTGNSVKAPSLSETDNLILSVIGRTTSQGLSDVPENCAESSTLESAQQRLKSIEQSSTEATLELARSNLKLAEAIERASNKLNVGELAQSIENVGSRLILAIENLSDKLSQPVHVLDSDSE